MKTTFDKIFTILFSLFIFYVFFNWIIEFPKIIIVFILMIGIIYFWYHSFNKTNKKHMSMYFCKTCDRSSWQAPFEKNICDECWVKEQYKKGKITKEEMDAELKEMTN